jgi:hypothetical protein
MFSAQIFQENTFLKTKLNFPLTGKCFPLTSFSNGKQTQESLESDFPEITFQKTNTTKRKNTFLETKPNFSLTEKCFLLTNFSNGKQTQESLESGFPETTFLETNMALDFAFSLLPCYPYDRVRYCVLNAKIKKIYIFCFNISH